MRSSMAARSADHSFVGGEGEGGEGLGGGGGGLGGGNTQHSSLLRPHSPTTGPGQQFAVSGRTGTYAIAVLGSNGQIHGP